MIKRKNKRSKRTRGKKSSNKNIPHFVNTKENPLVALLSTTNNAIDLGASLLGCPDFLNMGQVYKRYRVKSIQCTYLSTIPTQASTACYPICYGYNPNTLTPPGGAVQVFDLKQHGMFSPFSITTHTFTFAPKFSSNASIGQNNPTPDADGFLPFDANNPAYCGSLQTWCSGTPTVSGVIGVVIIRYNMEWKYQG